MAPRLQVAESRLPLDLRVEHVRERRRARPGSTPRSRRRRTRMSSSVTGAATSGWRTTGRSGRRDLVEPAHRRRVRRVPRDLRVLLGLGEDLLDRLPRTRRASPSPRSRSARPSAPRRRAAGSRRSADGSRSRAGAWRCRASSRRARASPSRPESTNSCLQVRSNATGRYVPARPRRMQREQVVGVQDGGLGGLLAGRRRRGSGCTRRSARTRRSCPGTRAAGRSTSGRS